jgi:hypothetical protein
MKPDRQRSEVRAAAPSRAWCIPAKVDRHVKAALRASSAMAMSEAPPNTMSMATRRPSAQTSVREAGDDDTGEDQIDDAVHHHPGLW